MALGMGACRRVGGAAGGGGLRRCPQGPHLLQAGGQEDIQGLAPGEGADGGDRVKEGGAQLPLGGVQAAANPRGGGGGEGEGGLCRATRGRLGAGAGAHWHAARPGVAGLQRVLYAGGQCAVKDRYR